MLLLLLLKFNRRFRATCRLHAQVEKPSKRPEWKQVANRACHLLSHRFLARLIFWPWRWRGHVRVEHPLTFNRLQGIISHKIVLFNLEPQNTVALRVYDDEDQGFSTVQMKPWWALGEKGTNQSHRCGVQNNRDVSTFFLCAVRERHEYMCPLETVNKTVPCQLVYHPQVILKFLE
jgi:hypothetical protein